MQHAPKPFRVARAITAVVIRLERRVQRRPDTTFEKAAALLRPLLEEINAERKSATTQRGRLH
jgi:hypothetical protein